VVLIPADSVFSDSNFKDVTVVITDVHGKETQCGMFTNYLTYQEVICNKPAISVTFIKKLPIS
jgi:hypothetical protein